MKQTKNGPERIGDEAIPELQEPPHKSEKYILPKVTFFRQPFGPDDIPCFRTDNRRLDFDDFYFCYREFRRFSRQCLENPISLLECWLPHFS